MAKIRMRDVKERIRNMTDEEFETSAMQSRVKCIPRWMEICGVTDPKDIDYTEPHVGIEFLLCDLRHIKAIKKDAAAWANEYLTEEESRIFYLEGYLTEVRNVSIFKSGRKQIGNMIKTGDVIIPGPKE